MCGNNGMQRMSQTEREREKEREGKKQEKHVYEAGQS